MGLHPTGIELLNASTYLQPPSQRKLWGVAGVVLLHALLLWGLQAGLHRTLAQKLPTVVQAILLEEKRPEPPPAPAPPPPPPAPPSTPKPPPVTPPAKVPPAFVPPAEVPAPAAPAKAIAAVTTSPAPPNPAPVAQVAPAPPAPPAPAAAPPARTVAGVNMAQCDKPEYPSTSKRLEEEGTVALRFLVGVDGKVIQSEIEKSSGFKRLDEAARAGLSKCQFRPATVDGKPEQAWTTIRYVWRLE
jgi:protein TonB